MLIWKILAEALEKNASDIILTSNAKPAFKIDWDVVYAEEYEVLNSKELDWAILNIMSDRQKEVFKKELELDFSLNLKDYSRFRVNIFIQRRGICAVFRPIKNKLPNFEDLHIPEKLIDFTKKKNGLVLITWSVWSGKSTTLSSLIEHINTNQSKHIITIEDPIEYMFQNKKSVVEQREVWVDTLSFANWLQYALRQASDVIMIWEMRDLDTFRLALRAAETWNLVFATLHTSWAAKTIARIIDMFPWDEKEQIKAQLSNSLVWVVWQNLIKRSDWKGRVPACELLVNNTSISNMIRKDLTHQINWVIETSKAEGMIPMAKSLEKLYNEGIISKKSLEENADFE